MKVPVWLGMFWPSAMMLILYVVGLCAERLTAGGGPSMLFTLWNVLSALAVGVGVYLVWQAGLLRAPFYASLILQVPVWVALYYHGGLAFTHKF